jgi:hypothetical protein
MARPSNFPRNLFRLILALFVWSFAATALAAPVALITEVDGTSEPAIEPFSEIDAGAKFTLGAETRVVFVDYATCQTVTVVGGQLLFTERRYLVRKGKIVGTKRARCPKVVSLNIDSQVAGVVLRSGVSVLRVKSQPRFVFTGPSRGQIEAVRVFEGDRIIGKGKPENNRFDWPADAAVLGKGQEYLLEVVTVDGKTAKRVPFRITGKGTSDLTVVRVE